MVGNIFLGNFVGIYLNMWKIVFGVDLTQIPHWQETEELDFKG